MIFVYYVFSIKYITNSRSEFIHEEFSQNISPSKKNMIFLLPWFQEIFKLSLPDVYQDSILPEKNLKFLLFFQKHNSSFLKNSAYKNQRIFKFYIEYLVFHSNFLKINLDTKYISKYKLL